ncbi:type II secretion system protein [Acidithiobacillus caldus]
MSVANERGVSLLSVLFALAISAILLAVFVPKIAGTISASQEAHLSRGMYHLWQDWTKWAITQGGATLVNQNGAIVLIGAGGRKEYLSIPSNWSVNMAWSPFASGNCQSLDGEGMPVTTPTASCSTPFLSSTNSIPLLSACNTQGECVGAHA